MVPVSSMGSKRLQPGDRIEPAMGERRQHERRDRDIATSPPFAVARGT